MDMLDSGQEVAIIPPDPIEQTQSLMKAFNMAALSALDRHHKPQWMMSQQQYLKTGESSMVIS